MTAVAQKLTDSQIRAIVPAEAAYKGTALLITCNNLTGRWAPKWLEHAGLAVEVANTPEQAIEISKSSNLSLIIADAALETDDRACLLERLVEVSRPTTPVIGLCKDEEEVEIAQDANASDAFPAPYDWRAITKRCVKIVLAHEILGRLQEAHERIVNVQATTFESQEA